MASATPAQKRATKAHRAKMRRVELLLDPKSPEVAALDRLTGIYGSASAAVRGALLIAADALRKVPAPKPAPVQSDPAKPALDIPVGPVPIAPGARLKAKR